MALFSKGGPDDYQSLLAKGDREGAVKVLRRLTRKAPDEFALGVQLAETLEKMGKREEAVAEFIRVGESQEQKGYHTKALALYRRAEKLAPERADLKAKLGGKPESAASPVRQAIAASQAAKTASDSFDIDLDPAAEPAIETGAATLAPPEEDFSADDIAALDAAPEELPAAEMISEPEPEPAPAPSAPSSPEPPPAAPARPSAEELLAASAAAETAPHAEPEPEPEPQSPEFSGILSGLNADEAALVAARFQSRRYEPGDRIITEGEPGESMYFIRAGVVRVSTMTDAGLLELGELKPGDYFGEVSLLKKVRRTATVSALEETELLELTRADLDALRPEIPDLLERLEGGLARRAQATITAITRQIAGR